MQCYIYKVSQDIIYNVSAQGLSEIMEILNTTCTQTSVPTVVPQGPQKVHIDSTAAPHGKT